MEKENIHGLPPSKRFKLLHSKENTRREYQKSLPAKKRAELRNNSCTSICLPAKKRIWAPLDIQIEEEEEIETRPFKEIQREIEQEENKTKTFKEIQRELRPEEIKTKTKPSKETQREIKVEVNKTEIKTSQEIQREIKNDDTKTQPSIEIHEEVEEDNDDGIICAVCQSTDGDQSDPIVFCDGCDLMVHVTCYGNPLIKSIPEGDWFCAACESKAPKKAKRCSLCPKKGGALKPTIDNKWAHIMCALLVPEVFFRDSEGRDGIDCSKVPKKRWTKKCYICEKNEGCVIFCAESRCELGFHVSCGLDEGHSIEYRRGKGGDIVAGFCREHTELWEKQQLTGKFRIVASDKETKQKTRN